MDKELKEKWIAALRSGDYCQTKGKLIDEQGYCCLGVLCDVAGTPQNENEEFIDTVGQPLNEIGYSATDIYGGTGVSTSTRQGLARANDQGDTFDRIADWIEENL